ncbi:MAG: hypothetical protein BVN33_05780 [Proteobacteria bacterium ST_bin13]|nr:MAG: hypothetical protein BVN33_05780 [Proteobacteria bacterium ST_bin13]
MFELIPHPDTPPTLIRRVQMALTLDPAETLLTIRVQGAENLNVPDLQPPARADNLWKTTCFEVFLNPAGTDQYSEFNFSPSRQWAAYAFDSYRHNMRSLDLSFEPIISQGIEVGGVYLIEIDLDLSIMPPGPLKMNLSAVIEERDGTKSYWALAHAPGPPDFHNRDCFIATLPAPSAP